jgi:hypothetical protein
LGAIFVAAVVYVKCVAKQELSKVTPLATCLVSFLDMITDVVFSVQLAGSALQMWATLSLLLSAAGNLVGVMLIMKREMQHEEFVAWIKAHTYAAAAVCVMSLSNAECLRKCDTHTYMHCTLGCALHRFTPRLYFVSPRLCTHSLSAFLRNSQSSWGVGLVASLSSPRRTAKIP